MAQVGVEMCIVHLHPEKNFKCIEIPILDYNPFNTYLLICVFLMR